MNKIFIILCIELFSLLPLLAQTNNKTIPKYELGIGVTRNRYFSWPEYWGGSLRFNYFLNDKLSIGANSILMPTRASSGRDGETETVHHNSLHFLANLSTTYFLLGGNYSIKTGLYTNLGLGYWQYKDSYSRVTQGMAPYSYDYVNIERGLGSTLTLGGNVKIGPGKVFLETVALFNVAGTGTSERIIISGNYPYSDPGSKKYPISFHLYDLFFNAGYSFSF